ncbi:MAG: GYD domain-containing protein [Nocardioides sp.]|nr:GYD domain-containing protein [Nocardioides sp.]
MPKYAVFFTFRPKAVNSLIATPSDRAAVVRTLCESAGGRMESYYLMLGSQYDGFIVIEVPDSATLTALSLAVTSSGSFSHVESHELVESGDLAGILSKASGLTYTPPGDE